MRYANESELPLCCWLAATDGDYQPVPHRYSVTELQKGTTEAALSRRWFEEAECDIADLANAMIGNGLHKLMEGVDDGCCHELRIECKLDCGCVVSGIIDHYDPSDGTVTDFKTCSSKANLDGYWQQVRAYAWMLAANGEDVRYAALLCFQKDTGRIVHHKAELTSYDLESAHDWLEKRATMLDFAMSLPDHSLPPCTAEERWKREDVYALMKDGRKTAVKLYASETDALLAAQEKGADHYVSVRRGENIKCERYCNVRQWCKWYRNNYTAKEGAAEHGSESVFSPRGHGDGQIIFD